MMNNVPLIEYKILYYISYGEVRGGCRRIY
jgi:hypothetical protein